MNQPKDLKDIPLLNDPRVKVDVVYHEQITVTYPPELRDEMLTVLGENGFYGCRYSGPVCQHSGDYDPEKRQRREITYREIIL